MEMPKMSNGDLYKFVVYTLLQHDFSILSTQNIASIGAKILIHKPLEFRHMKVGALKLNEGDIGGYPIPQYRKKKLQIPKYRVENRLNTDTAYFNHIYNRFRILMVASI